MKILLRAFNVFEKAMEDEDDFLTKDEWGIRIFKLPFLRLGGGGGTAKFQFTGQWIGDMPVFEFSNY